MTPAVALPLRESQLALPRSAVRLLAACAKSHELCPELALVDAVALSLFRELDGNVATFGAGELRCAAFRTWVVDRLAESFFARCPEGLGVSLWPMLGTRAHRLHAHNWVELDAAPLAALRQRYLPARPGWTQLTSCLCSAGRAAHEVGGPGPRLFVMDEAVLPLHAVALSRMLDSLCAHARPGSELIVAFAGCSHLRVSRAGMLELALGDGLARYPRLRAVDSARYGDDLQSSLQGVSAVARLQGHDAPALAHLAIV